MTSITAKTSLTGRSAQITRMLSLALLLSTGPLASAAFAQSAGTAPQVDSDVTTPPPVTDAPVTDATPGSPEAAEDPALPDFAPQDSGQNIIGSEVTVGDSADDTEAGSLLASIESTAENADRVKLVWTIDKIDVVYVSEVLGETPSEEIDAAIRENAAAAQELQRALEASAIFYNALESQDILLRDIVAVEFKSDTEIVIFVSGEPPL
jgi:hypothetical protein